MSIGIAILFLTGIENPGAYSKDPVFSCVAGRSNRDSLNGVMPSTAPGVFGEFSCIVASRRTVAEIELDG
jgi:hypothetical protein